jgi:DNA-binding transcriptional MerR regulator
MYRISEVAERSGFSPATLRFYDQIGLVEPVGRSEAGYRYYDDAALERLRFVERAKTLGLSLDEMAELVPLLDQHQCGPVQDRLRVLVDSKVADTQRQTAELVALLGQLQAVAARMSSHTPDGPCDDECGCTSDVATAGEPISLRASVIRPDEPLIACTLQAGEMEQRMAEWQHALESATRRTEIDQGVRVTLDRSTDVAGLAQLLADEQTCCSFFTFALTLTSDQIFLDVMAPADGLPMVQALFGCGT